MKRNLFWIISLVLFSTTLTMTSCEDDPCKDVVCDANSDCFDGECICRVGYEKDAAGNCTLEREKFLGTWTAADDCSASGTATYVVTATKGGSDNEVAIANFWNVFANAVVATTSGSTITIERQEPDSDSFYVEGSGTISGSTITWTYKITDESVTPIDTDNCTSTWTK
jgi:hypothetical protein